MPSNSSSGGSINLAVKLIGPGDITDDDNDYRTVGDQMIGTITALNYSASHNSAMNKAYVAAFKKANNGMRPNFSSVGGYDGMHLIHEALKKTGGSINGAKLIEAMKGLAWESPSRSNVGGPGDTRRRPEHLSPQSGEDRGRTLQQRVRDVQAVKTHQGSQKTCELGS